MTEPIQAVKVTPFLSHSLRVPSREIFLPAKRMLLWQGKLWAQNYGGSSPEILQHNQP